MGMPCTAYPSTPGAARVRSQPHADVPNVAKRVRHCRPGVGVVPTPTQFICSTTAGDQIDSCFRMLARLNEALLRETQKRRNASWFRAVAELHC